MGLLVPRPVDSTVSQYNSRRVTTTGDPPRCTHQAPQCVAPGTAPLARKFLVWFGEAVGSEDLSASGTCDVLYELRRKFSLT